MFTENDLKQINDKNINIELINQQLENFKNGFAYTQLHKAAIIGDGIIKTNANEEINYIESYKRAIAEGLDVFKFVPASGAATRMFKSLFEFLNADESQKATLLTQQPYCDFFKHIRQFAFIDELEKVIEQQIQPDNIDISFATLIIEGVLLEQGLNYGYLPKGLLKFHKEEKRTFTPVEEHLKETAHYASSNNIGKIHFTVSPEHHKLFMELVDKCRKKMEGHYGLSYAIDFSFQKQSTDTIAVNPDNTPFRNEDGSLLFRPAGHGALIQNLNELTEEVIFIKNIDNVVPEHLQSDTSHYKQVLAGLLLDKQKRITAILSGLEGDKNQSAITSGTNFICEELQLNRTEIDALTEEEKVTLIKEQLNRPIRVCGMVKNEGEPGGGPFWVKQNNGHISLQIVEGAQIDPDNAEQQAILNNSTHFNPVDLICYTKDYKGQKFDLTQFVDPDTGFISEKTQNGKALKALELPGLWNGAMAHWLTFFVEVPISTFNPVKTVIDLLRPQHQPAK